MLILKNCKFIPFLTEGTDLVEGDVLVNGFCFPQVEGLEDQA